MSWPIPTALESLLPPKKFLTNLYHFCSLMYPNQSHRKSDQSQTLSYKVLTNFSHSRLTNSFPPLQAAWSILPTPIGSFNQSLPLLQKAWPVPHTFANDLINPSYWWRKTWPILTTPTKSLTLPFHSHWRSDQFLPPSQEVLNNS